MGTTARSTSTDGAAPRSLSPRRLVLPVVGAVLVNGYDMLIVVPPQTP
jgi:hypothetical protein